MRKTKNNVEVVHKGESEDYDSEDNKSEGGSSQVSLQDWQNETSSKLLPFSKISRIEMDEVAHIRQKLELKLANTELEQAVKMDEHKVIENRLARVEGVLRALLSYLDCLTLESKSAKRLCQQINELVVNDAPEIMCEDFSIMIKKTCDKQQSKDLTAIKARIYETLEESKHAKELILEYLNRSKDYGTASQNFKLLLDNASLNLKQLNHLQRQYDGILVNLQQSRIILDQELPEVITNFMAVLVAAFECVGKDVGNKKEERFTMFNLMENLSASLEDSGLIILKRNFKGLKNSDVRRSSCKCNCSRSTEK